jgi:ATP-binding cassette subfamily C (CFTR/MRP) protein 1
LISCYLFPDAGTSKKIFDRLIKSPSASILSESAIVLVTHAAHFLNRVDMIMVVVEGEAKFLGTWADLSVFTTDDQKTTDAIEYIRSSVQEGAEIEGGGKVGPKSGEVVLDDDPDGKKNDGKVITVEEREHGLSSLSTWLLWFKYAGGVPFLVMQFLLLTLDRLAYVSSEYWL